MNVRSTRAFLPFLVTSAAVFFLLLTPASATSQDDDDEHSMLFWISENYLRDLATKRTIRYPLQMTMDDRSNVHGIASDCEIHVAWVGATDLASPSAVVAEPPNLCKVRLGGVSQTGAIGTAWANFFDSKIMGKECTVTGFPRIFAEHVAGAGTGGSNADHVLEIHPALQISCEGGADLDFSPALKIFPGMRKITDESAATCIENRKLWVRKHDNRYEFAEEGAKGPGGQCGNFVALEATVHAGYVREFDKDEQGRGDHSAIAWVTASSYGPFPIKIYTYRGTPEDGAVAEISQGIEPHRKPRLHGLLTYDYFTIVRVVQDKNRNWLDEIEDWREVYHPLALVVFGTWSP
jgi:hypothetical protein